MKNRYFYMDKEDGSIISIIGKRKSVKCYHSYIVNEYSNECRRWVMPCFPEIYWGQLVERFTYIGKVKCNENYTNK